MPDVPQHVVALLAALKFSDPRPEQLRSLSDAEWKTLLSFWDFVRFMIPLRQAWGDTLPDWVRGQIDSDIVGNTGRFERIKADYSQIAHAIVNANADHVVLKGFAQWPGYVEHPRFRRQSDIDLYCPPDSIVRAREALSGIGYETVDWVQPGPSDHIPPMIRKTGWKWQGDFFDPEMPISVEIHFRLWDKEGLHFGPADLDQFWFRRVERKVDDLVFPSLSPVDGLGYFSLNVLRDLVRGRPRTYNLYELARFLHTNADDERFWQNWLDLHEDTIRPLEAIAFRLASHFFDNRLPEPVQREIDSLPAAVNSWFELYGDSPLTTEFHENKDLVWLHLSLIGSARDKRAVLLKRLFPQRITSIDAPYIDASSESTEKHKDLPLRRRARHLGYVASRTAYHLRVLPSTLWHGARWWLATKNISRGFWTFFATSFLFDLGMYIFFILYNLYLLDRGFKENFLGMVASASAIGGMVGTIPAGMLAQRFGLRKAIFVCLTALPVIFSLRSVVGQEAALVALAFLGGATVSIWAVCISPAIAQLTDEHSRPFGFSLIFSAGIGIGILGGQIAGRLPGWLSQIGTAVTELRAKQLALLISCGMMALAALPVSRLRFTSAPAQERKLYPRNPFLLRYLPAIAIWSLAIGAFSPFFNAYLSQHLRMPVHQIGVIFSWSHVSQFVAVLAAPIVFKKFGLVTGIMYTQIAAAIGLACLAAIPRASAAAVIYVGYMAFQWMSEPGMFSLLMNQVSPAERTGASTLNFLVINISQAIAATAAGASFARFGYPAVMGVTAAVALVAALLLRLLLGGGPLSVSQASPASLEA